MLLQVEPDSPVPIYEQIVDQVTYAVAAGSLPPGSLIPSVRDLAVKLMVHPNTVAKAFQELERRAIVTSVRGKGMAVTEEGPEICRERRLNSVRERIRSTLREAVASGLSRNDVRRLVDDELAAAGTPTPFTDGHFKGKR